MEEISQTCCDSGTVPKPVNSQMCVKADCMGSEKVPDVIHLWEWDWKHLNSKIQIWISVNVLYFHWTTTVQAMLILLPLHQFDIRVSSYDKGIPLILNGSQSKDMQLG